MLSEHGKLIGVEVFIGVMAGVLSGLFGVGGGIVLVPLITLLLHVRQKDAHATSLVAVCLTSLVGSASYAITGNVYWLAVVMLAVGGIVGARIGAATVRRISDRRLRIAFAVLLCVVAVVLLTGVTPKEGLTAGLGSAGMILKALGYLGTGLVAGVLSGLFGVGGGLIMIPLLVLIGGLDQHVAEGTSLAAIAPIALVGALEHSKSGYTRWSLGVRLGLGGALGSLAGVTLALALSGTVLQRIFAVVLAAAAIQMVLTSRGHRG